jgi:hypothetical protein
MLFIIATWFLFLKLLLKVGYYFLVLFFGFIEKNVEGEGIGSRVEWLETQYSSQLSKIYD